MKTEEVYYRLAFSQIKGVGPVRFKKVLEAVNDTSLIFTAKRKFLKYELGLPESVVQEIITKRDFKEIDSELNYVIKNNIQILFYDEINYPNHLNHCLDGPPFIFYKGKIEALQKKCISIIGTRHNTDYGRRMTEELIEALKPYPINIVSGLAYGIDIIAHKAALKNNMSTIGVLAHGFNEIYPPTHHAVANEMQEEGGLITEYFFNTTANKENFPSRNRIVAGMSEATIIVETNLRGGSMITAELAYSYNKDVFCFPGKATDVKSAGCNLLIKNLKAQLITNADDLIFSLGWKQQRKKDIQRNLFIQLSEDEEKIVEALSQNESIHIDELLMKSNLSTSQLSSAMLTLELQGVISVMPGKLVSLI